MFKNLKKTTLLASVMGALALVLLLLCVKIYFDSFAKKRHFITQAVIDIPYGTSLKRVSQLLYENKIIDNANVFYWYLRVRREANKLQAGFYQFDGEISNEQIVDSLRTGRDRAIKIIFKEGESLRDLVRILEQNSLTTEEQFIVAMNKSDILSLIPTEAKARRLLKNDMGGIEGYLFPDTYFFTKKDNAESIIKKMHQRLTNKLEGAIFERIKEKGLTLHFVLTLAAIVEKETGASFERPIIASVYQNRLLQGMRLQADPTVIYGIKDYAGKIHKADLLSFHPYNTYVLAGLPPGPIAAPGLESIRAVLWPSETKYLFFVSKNDGTHIFCENLTCHNKAVKLWQIDYFKAKTQAKK